MAVFRFLRSGIDKTVPGWRDRYAKAKSGKVSECGAAENRGGAESNKMRGGDRLGWAWPLRSPLARVWS